MSSNEGKPPQDVIGGLLKERQEKRVDEENREKEVSPQSGQPASQRTGHESAQWRLGLYKLVSAWAISIDLNTRAPGPADMNPLQCMGN